MARFLYQSFVILVVATSAIVGVPCDCEAAEHAVTADPAPSEHGCCPSQAEESEREAAHDCPSCASGACDAVAVLADSGFDLWVAAAPTLVVAYAVASVSGPPDVPSNAHAPPPTAPPEPTPCVASARETCVQNQVFRC